MIRPIGRTLAGSAALAMATGLSLGVPAQAQTIEIPEDPCNINYFEEEAMWEISWGAAYYEQRRSFNRESYGGLTSVNGEDVPAYITDADQWHWWYVTAESINAPGGTQVDLEFADGTHWRGEAVPDANGCPATTWTINPPAEPDPEPTTGSLGSVMDNAVFGSLFGSLGAGEDEGDENTAQ